jgi:hypothetical protein
MADWQTGWPINHILLAAQEWRKEKASCPAIELGERTETTYIFHMCTTQIWQTNNTPQALLAVWVITLSTLMSLARHEVLEWFQISKFLCQYASYNFLHSVLTQLSEHLCMNKMIIGKGRKGPGCILCVWVHVFL